MTPGGPPDDDPGPHRRRTGDGGRRPEGARGDPAADRTGAGRPCPAHPPGASRSEDRERRGPGRDPQQPRRVPTIPERAPLPAAADRLPPLADPARTSLARGLALLGLADLPDEARIGLEDHLRLLLAWTRAINLTAIRDPEAAVAAHILDSSPPCRSSATRGRTRSSTSGAAAATPGSRSPSRSPPAVRCSSTRSRRRPLPRDRGRRRRAGRPGRGRRGQGGGARRATRVSARPGRRSRRAPWPTWRTLVELAFPLLARDGILVAWKQGDLAGERARALPAIAALGGGRLDIAAAGPAAPAGHVLVVVRKTGRTAAGWPRPIAERRHRPWRG